jgi:putative FmdB family regulatory protein
VPTYDYQCRSCGSTTEVIHSMLEDGPKVCERCGGELRRVLYPTGIIFKGSGFYRTDSRASAKAAGGSTGDGGSKADSSPGASTKESGAKETGARESGSKDAAGTTKKAEPA